MPISAPPARSIRRERVSCGSMPRSYPSLPSVSIESALPDDLLLSAQGVRFESSNPLPITDEGELDTTNRGQFRAIRIRRSTPQGVSERVVVAVDIGNQAHAVLGDNPSGVVVNPPSESALEVATEAQEELPVPDYYEETVVSKPSSGVTTQSLFLAELAAREAAKAATSGGSSPGSAPISYNTPTTSYSGSAPSGSSTPTPTGSGISQLSYPGTNAEIYEVQNQTQFQPIGQSPSQTQSILEQLELLGQSGFGYYGPGY